MLSIPSKIVGKNDFEAIECGAHIFTKEMCKFCGRVMTIKDIGIDFYIMDEDVLGYEFTDEMIEGLVEEEMSLNIDDFQDDNEILDIIDEYVHRLKGNECQINLPDGYIFKDENGNIINATKIVLEKKEYPKTYEECCKILGIENSAYLTTDEEGYWNDYELGLNYLIEHFRKLIICRDAYWKIAGEEMGLGKPWENSRCEVVYGICREEGDIVKRDDCWGATHLFEFPIREMRDAFKENFDSDIEICKEFL
jgi:hypothetical protein